MHRKPLENQRAVIDHLAVAYERMCKWLKMTSDMIQYIYHIAGRMREVQIMQKMQFSAQIDYKICKQ